MTVFYFASAAQADLASMLIKMVGNQPVLAFPNALGPLPAVPKVPASTDANGNPIPEQPARGVEGQWYLSVIDTEATVDADGKPVFSGTIPTGVTEDAANGQAVLGVWE